MKKLSLLGLALALALPLLAAARPAAAAQPTVVVQATSDTNPFAVLFVDDANGNSTIDTQKSGKVHDDFAGLPYVITSDGNLQVGSPNGSGFHLTAGVADTSSGKGLSYIFHGTLAANSGLLVTGNLFRSSTDPTKGVVYLSLTIPEQNGGIESAWVQQLLTFAGSSPTPTPSPAPTPGPGF